MRKQLRPFYTPQETADLYRDGYNHASWVGHRQRVEFSAWHLDQFAGRRGAWTIADLSAGDGGILNQSLWQWHDRIIGDITTTGPIEEQIKTVPHVDMFLCSETLEHVEDPDTLLRDIRKKSNNLFLTTPNGEDNDGNPEHYWGWDTKGLDRMLKQAGWTQRDHLLFTPPDDDWYEYQVWMCS